VNTYYVPLKYICRSSLNKWLKFGIVFHKFHGRQPEIAFPERFGKNVIRNGRSKGNTSCFSLISFQDTHIWDIYLPSITWNSFLTPCRRILADKYEILVPRLEITSQAIFLDGLLWSPSARSGEAPSTHRRDTFLASLTSLILDGIDIESREESYNASTVK
jgi:hypothetical protein